MFHIIAIGRLRTDDKTKEYVAKKVAEGHTKMEAIYLSRSLYITAKSKQTGQHYSDNDLTVIRASRGLGMYHWPTHSGLRKPDY